MAEERRDRGQGGNGQGGGPGREGGRRFGRRRFGRGGPRPGEGQRAPQGEGPEGREAPAPRPEPPLCPLCGKAIYDLSTALAADRDAGLPAHFDCIVERIGAAESLGPGERVVYLGSGSFGVVEYRDKGETLFTVKRRVQWEKEGEKKDWRKTLSARIAKI